MSNGRRISTTITHTVQVGGTHFPSPLTVTATGVIDPAAYGATGVNVAASVTDATIRNLGTIAGGFSGNYHGNGGIGVDLQAAASISNDGTIAGGGVGLTATQNSYQGGAGIMLAAGGSVSNRGEIVGGGSAAGFGGDATNGSIGGDGMDVVTGGIVINHGMVTGGAGGYGTKFGGGGGTGILFDHGGMLSNSGTITGGEAGQSSYAGFGKLGGTGVDLANGGSIFNAGTILGGLGQYNAGGGGIGVQVDAGSLSNNGTIIGGTAGFGYDGGADGGAAVDLSNGATGINRGDIYGGTGSYSHNYGGNGGAGVELQNATLTAFGTIMGGTGGNGGYGGGYGGAGVYIDGGELIAEGTIVGGNPGHEINRFTPPAGYAVEFGTVAGTLLIDPSAKITGDIVANPTVNDVLALGGETAGTLSGFGVAITGFTTIAEDASAHWLLSGDISGEGSITIAENARLALDGTVSIASIVFGGGGGETLSFGSPSNVTSTLAGFAADDIIHLSGIAATSLAFHAGTLTLYDAGHTVIDKLFFSGSYTQNDFGLQDHNGNTDILFTGTAAASGAGDVAAAHQTRILASWAHEPGAGPLPMLWHVPVQPG